jgi:hypothetical protein
MCPQCGNEDLEAREYPCHSYTGSETAYYCHVCRRAFEAAEVDEAIEARREAELGNAR